MSWTAEPPEGAQHGVHIKIDYDPRRWILIPPAEAMDRTAWARDTAHAWARDLQRERDANWQQVLEKMLLRAASSTDAARWDARLIHMLTPARQAPSPALTNVLLSVPDDVPGVHDALSDLVGQLHDRDDPLLVEPPAIETVELHRGVPATRILRYTRGENDDSVMVGLYVTWRAGRAANLTLWTVGYNLGRVVAMRDDVVDLARSISLVPLGEASA